MLPLSKHLLYSLGVTMITIICGKCKKKIPLAKLVEKLDNNAFKCDCGKTLVKEYEEWQ